MRLLGLSLVISYFNSVTEFFISEVLIDCLVASHVAASGLKKKRTTDFYTVGGTSFGVHSKLDCFQRAGRFKNRNLTFEKKKFGHKKLF
jgi:hypothetical protein